MDFLISDLRAALPPWQLTLPLLTISYMILVRVLRFRALKQMQRKYAAYTSNPYTLTYKQAQEIMSLAFLHDTPFLFTMGMQYALIKCYGIASGTPLLVKTRQLVHPDKIGRRAEDTGIFFAEMLAGDIDSERGRRVVAKMNWLHGRYTIKHGDLVYTLALLVLEPQLWVDRFGWRGMTDLEKAAHLVYWRELGQRMGFGGIPETIEELKAWREEYEKENRYFVEENRTVADATINLFLRDKPKFMRGVLRKLLISFIDDKNDREALGFPDPPAWATFVTTSCLRLSGFIVRHLFLPRGQSMDLLPKQGPDGRLYRRPEYVLFEPWYLPDTWLNRLNMWFRFGGKVDHDKIFKSGGYMPEELGPIGTQKVATKAVREHAAAMGDYAHRGGSAVVGCPFSFG